jgi:hypothetical protein
MYSIHIFFVAFISLVEAIDEFALNISIVHNVRTVEQHAEIPVDCCLSFVCVCVCACSKKVVLLSALEVAFT